MGALNVDRPLVVRGYRGPVHDVRALLARIAAARDALPLQLMRADRVYGVDHLRHAATLAARAVAAGRARSADLPTETLLYAAGERQVGRAIDFLGLRDGMDAIAAVAWGPAEALDAFAQREGWVRDDAVLDGDEAVLDAFGVTDDERAMLPRARWGEFVLERVGLVDVLKA